MHSHEDRRGKINKEINKESLTVLYFSPLRYYEQNLRQAASYHASSFTYGKSKGD